MIFIQLAFNTTKKFPHSWSRGNMYNFRDATRGCARILVWRPSYCTYTMCKCSSTKFSLFRGIFPRWSSRALIYLRLRASSRLYEKRRPGFAFPLLRATKTRWRDCVADGRIGRWRWRKGDILLYVREQISWIHFATEGARRKRFARSAGKWCDRQRHLRITNKFISFWNRYLISSLIWCHRRWKSVFFT